MSWERLIRFEDESGQQRFGEPVIKDADELEALLGKGELFANEFKGSDPFTLEATGQKTKVAKLLGILEPTDVPIVKCVGLNYMKHSKSNPPKERVRFPPIYYDHQTEHMNSPGSRSKTTAIPIHLHQAQDLNRLPLRRHTYPEAGTG